MKVWGLCALGLLSLLWKETISACSDPNCYRCDSRELCEDCYSGFYLPPDNTRCTPCPPNCHTCYHNKTCGSCNYGYYMAEGNLSCIMCPMANCLACSGPTNCTFCSLGFTLNQTNSSHCDDRRDDFVSTGKNIVWWFVVLIIVLLVICVIGAIVAVLWLVRELKQEKAQQYKDLKKEIRVHREPELQTAEILSAVKPTGSDRDQMRFDDQELDHAKQDPEQLKRRKLVVPGEKNIESARLNKKEPKTPTHESFEYGRNSDEDNDDL